MSVVPDFDPARPTGLPTPDRLLGELDRKLKADAAGNVGDVQAGMRGQIPARSGRTRAGVRASVRQSRRGYGISTRVEGEAAMRLRFVSGGTGSRGGHGRIPKARRGFLRGSGVPSGRGQRPQQSWKKALEQGRKVTAEMERQMRAAWTAATRGLD